MSKRGERRPFLVRYEWANGVKGSQSFPTIDQAHDFERKIVRNAELIDRAVTIQIVCRIA